MNKTPLDMAAFKLVGDGQTPNIFFVSTKGNVFLITTDFDIAHRTWKALPKDQETDLEDRLIGVIASTEPDETGKLVIYAYSKRFDVKTGRLL